MSLQTFGGLSRVSKVFYNVSDTVLAESNLITLRRSLFSVNQNQNPFLIFIIAGLESEKQR